MAIQSVPAFPWPAHPMWRSGATAYQLTTNTYTIDSSSDRVALIFQAPKTGTLDRMEFNVAGGTALQDIRAGWQDVGLATGFPDGVYDQYADLTGYSAGWQVPSYFGASGGGSGAKRSVTQGDLLAFVLSSTGGSPNITITSLAIGGGQGPILPQGAANLTGNYGLNAQQQPVCSLYYDGETDATPINWWSLGAHTISTANIISSGVRQAGLAFTLPFSCRLAGFAAMVDVDVDLLVRLYDSATNDALASAYTLGKDVPGAHSGAGLLELRFPSAVSITANQKYRAVLENTAATNCAIRYMDFNDNGDVAGWGGGKNCFWTQSNLAYASLVNEASWTDTDSRVPFMYLLIDGLDDGASGGGGGTVYVPGSQVVTGIGAH